MSFSRRTFIQTGTLAVISAACTTLLPQIALGQKGGTPGRPIPLDQLSRLSKEDFYTNLATKFRVTVETQQMDFELYDLEEISSAEKQGTDCFVLVFRGLHSHQIPQGTYSFSHSKLGKFDLYVTPGTLDGRMYYYNAIINRLPH